MTILNSNGIFVSINVYSCIQRLIQKVIKNTFNRDTMLEVDEVLVLYKSVHRQLGFWHRQRRWSTIWVFEDVWKNRPRICIHFLWVCYKLYSEIYLWKPTISDVEQLYAAHQNTHSFPWMLGNTDCIYLKWENCPNAWQGQFTSGDHGVPTIML